MKDPFIIADEINKELKEIEDLGLNLSERLSQLSQKIRYILSKIKSCETFNCAYEYFQLLEEIQGVLSKFIFEEEIGIPERLDRFVREFDRFVQDKETYFKKIKNDEYKF